MKAVGLPLDRLMLVLTGQVAAPVNDETDLTGPFDLELRWSTDASPSDDVPVIFTAVQEQLGLKLEKRRFQREVLVVDHIERASPN